MIDVQQVNRSNSRPRVQIPPSTRQIWQPYTVQNRLRFVYQCQRMAGQADAWPRSARLTLIPDEMPLVLGLNNLLVSKQISPSVNRSVGQSALLYVCRCVGQSISLWVSRSVSARPVGL